MKQHLSTILLVTVSGVLVVLLYFSLNENKQLKRELDAMSGHTSNAKLVAASPAVPDDPLTEEEPSRGLSVNEPFATNDVDPAVVERSLRNHQRVMTSIAKMRDNPTMNKVIEASQRGTIGALYSDLIEYLGLNSDETQYFMDLLMSRQMENVDFGMKLMSGQLSEDEKAEMAEHLASVSNQMKEQMKEFLNSGEDYEEFLYYEKTMNERMALSQMDQQLASTEQTLSDTQYRELLDMMYQERNDFNWSTDLHDQDRVNVSSERFSKENMAKHADDLGRLSEQLISQAMSILSTEQFDAFKASITATADMQLAQFEMAGQLLRGSE